MTLAEKLSQKDFVLSLSSGFFGFFAHCGFAKAVFSEGLKPKLLTGSSAGAIVAGCLASGMSPEEMEKEFLNLSRDHYWDPGLGAGILKGHRFEESLNQYLVPEIEKGAIPVHIACFNIKKRRTEIFKSGNFPKVVRASCAMPLFFHPVKIGQDLYWDGGIQDKMGWSEVDMSETVLGHNLSSGKVTDWFEQKKLNAHKNRIVLQVNNLPFTGPGKFANGKKAIALAYEETKRLLHSPA